MEVLLPVSWPLISLKMRKFLAFSSICTTPDSTELEAKLEKSGQPQVMETGH